MKKSYLIQFTLVLFFLCIGMNGFGQILEWNFNASTTGQEATVNATTNNANLETSILTRGSGALVSSTRYTKSFMSTMTPSSSKATAVTNNAYFQFTVQAKTGYYVSLTDLDVSLIISSATLSAMIYQFQYSLDGITFVNVGNPTTLTDTNSKGVFQPTIDLTQYTSLKNVPSTTVITFRLYAWGGATGDFGIGSSYSASVPTLIVGGIVSNTTVTVSNDPKIAAWEFSAYGTANPAPASIDATYFNGNLIIPTLSIGSGLNNATANYYYVAATSAKRTDKAAAISGNDYFQFTIPTGARNKVSLSTIKYRFKTSISSLNYIWRYSTDGGNSFSEIGTESLFTSSTGGLEYQLDLSGIANLQNVTSTILLRLYVWSSATTTSACGFGRILNGSNVGSTINCIYIRGKVDLDPMAIAVETTDVFQKKSFVENVVYFTNRIYTAYNIPQTMLNFEFLASNGGVGNDGITPTGTIIPSQDGDIYVIGRTTTAIPDWTLVNGTEFYYLAGSNVTGLSVFKKTVTAGQRIPIPVVDNFQEAKPFAKTINYNVYRSVASGNWSDNSKWEVSTDNINWSSAPTAPTSTVSSISIPAGQELVIDAPATASIITVNPAAKLTVNAATTFNATTLNLNSDATGTATFIDNGTSSITNANVQQYLSSGRNWYVSIPVSTAAGSALSSATSVVCWDETIGDWVSPALSTLNPMRGYISVNTTTSGNIMFSGQLNNGEKYIDLTYSAGKTKAGYNLVGNPYPSYLNWTADIANAANALTTIWYRTKVDGVYDFHTYNADGNVGSPVEITGQIPPMQAFWVKVKAGGGRLTFNNSMRSHGSVSVPLKAPGATSSSAAEQKLIRIKVTNHTNSDETVVYFNAKASDNFDSFDSPKMSNNNNVIPEIFTFADKEELVINGLNNSNTERVIPLGFRTGEANNLDRKSVV